MKTWQPEIPGTEYSRVDFIVTMQRIHHDPLSQTVFRVNAIRELAEYGLLTNPQIGRIVGCGTRATKTVMETLKLTPLAGVRGILDPRALPGMLLVCTRLAAGRKAEPIIVRELTRYVSPMLLERFTGLPLTTVNYHRKKAEGK